MTIPRASQKMPVLPRMDNSQYRLKTEFHPKRLRVLLLYFPPVKTKFKYMFRANSVAPKKEKEEEEDKFPRPLGHDHRVGLGLIVNGSNV